MKASRTSSVSGAELIAAVVETLDQGETLLNQLGDAVYTRPLPGAFNASIGGHYRHCLDHFRSLIEAAGAGDLDYDQRQRGTRVEQERSAALEATRTLRDRYRELGEACLERGLLVTCKTSYATSGSQAAPSTVGRELMYVVAHAVHHYALIGIMCGLQGVPSPPGFGVAPSTLQHQAEVTRA